MKARAQVSRSAASPERQLRCQCGRPAGPDGKCAACKARQRASLLSTAGTYSISPPAGRLEDDAERLAAVAVRGPLGSPDQQGVPGARSEEASPGVRLWDGGRPLPGTRRAELEARFGHDFSRVRIHSGARAARSAAGLNARAYTLGNNIVFGPEQYAPTTSAGQRLLAHELAHVVQQREIGRPIIQRDLALEPTQEVSEPRELTVAQVLAAIRYNRASYDRASTELIQDLVGVEQTGSFDEATVRAIAFLQEQFGLKPDGKAGPHTYDLLIRELQAESATPGTCLTLFQLVGPEPLRFFRNSPTSGTIGSRFFIHIRFDPRCNCADWEYRQYIAGHVELRDVAGPVFNLDSMFAIPGGGLPATLTEDGDVAIPAGVAGHRYGHRRAASNPSDTRDRYLPDRRTGCVYEAHDFPALGPIPAAAGDAGDVYDWVMRFRGVIRRRGHGVVQEKYWAIRGVITIPPP